MVLDKVTFANNRSNGRAETSDEIPDLGALGSPIPIEHVSAIKKLIVEELANFCNWLDRDV